MNALTALTQQLGAVVQTIASNSTSQTTTSIEREATTSRTRNSSTIEHASASKRKGKPKKPNSGYQSIFNVTPNPITKSLWIYGKVHLEFFVNN